jgi:hypothetical protein
MGARLSKGGRLRGGEVDWGEVLLAVC